MTESSKWHKVGPRWFMPWFDIKCWFVWFRLGLYSVGNSFSKLLIKTPFEIGIALFGFGFYFAVHRHYKDYLDGNQKVRVEFYWLKRMPW